MKRMAWKSSIVLISGSNGYQHAIANLALGRYMLNQSVNTDSGSICDIIVLADGSRADD